MRTKRIVTSFFLFLIVLAMGAVMVSAQEPTITKISNEMPATAGFKEFEAQKALDFYKKTVAELSTHAVPRDKPKKNGYRETILANIPTTTPSHAWATFSEGKEMPTMVLLSWDDGRAVCAYDFRNEMLNLGYEHIYGVRANSYEQKENFALGLMYHPEGWNYGSWWSNQYFQEEDFFKKLLGRNDLPEGAKKAIFHLTHFVEVKKEKKKK